MIHNFGLMLLDIFNWEDYWTHTTIHAAFAISFGSVGFACSMFSIESLVLPLGTFSPRVDGCNTPGGQNVYSLS